MAKLSISEFSNGNQEFPSSSSSRTGQLLDISGTAVISEQFAPGTRFIRLIPTENCWVHFQTDPDPIETPTYANSVLVTSFERQDFVVDYSTRYLSVVTATDFA